MTLLLTQRTAFQKPTHLQAHLYFLRPHRPTQKNTKEPPSQRTRQKTTNA